MEGLNIKIDELIKFYVNEMGWNILPLDKNKKLTYEKWKRYQTEFYPIDKLLSHEGNFAVVQGKISGNFIKLDFDTHFTCGYSTHQLYRMILEKCPELKNCIAIKSQSGAVHIGVYLTDMDVYKDLPRKNGVWCHIKGIKEIDIKGEGGLAVIPPSKINNNSYSFLNVKSLEELKDKEYPQFNKEEFGEIYDKLACLDFQTKVLKGLIHKAHRAIARGEVEIKSYAQSSKSSDEFNYWYAFELSCIHLGLTDTEIHYLLSRTQKAYIESKLQSDLNYLRNKKRPPYKINTLNKMYPEVEFQTATTMQNYNPFNDKLQDLYYEETGKDCKYSRGGKEFFTSEYSKWVKNKQQKEQSIEDDPYTIALEIVKENNILCPLEWGKTIMVYEYGYWKEQPIEVLEHLILGYFVKIKYHKESDSALLTKLNAVKKFVRKETTCYLNEFNDNPYLINLKNGIFDLTDLDNPKLLDHDPKYKLRKQRDIIYNKNAKCPEIDQLLKNVFHEEDIELICQKIGLSYTSLMNFQKSTILWGEGNNGKTTFYNMLTIHLGRENVSHVDPVDFKDTFLVSQMEGKTANICSEVDTQEELNITTLKMHVGGEGTFLINKKYEKPYNAIPTAKHWYGCNDDFMNIPNNANKGFFRKFDLIQCPNNFDGVEDRELEDKVTTQKEFSGFFNKCIKALIKLLKDKKFTNHCVALTQWEDVKDFWIERRNPFSQFIKEMCIKGEYKDAKIDVNNEFWELKEHVLTSYNNWRKVNGKPPISSLGKLTGMAKANGFINTRRKVGKRQEQIYGGFRLKNKIIEELEIEELFENEGYK